MKSCRRSLIRRKKYSQNIIFAIHEFQLDLRSGKQLAEYAETKAATSCYLNTKLEGHAKTTFLITFSPDKTKIASSHGDHTVRIFDVKTGNLLHSLCGHPRSPWCINFHPVHNYILASGCLSGEIRIWDLHNDSSQVFNVTNGKVIASLTFHPVNEILAVASVTYLLLLNWKSGEVINKLTTVGSPEYLRLVRFDYLGNWMLTGIINNTDKSCEPTLSELRAHRDPASSTTQSISCFRLSDRTQCPGTSAASSTTVAMALSTDPPDIPDITDSTVTTETEATTKTDDPNETSRKALRNSCSFKDDSNARVSRDSQWSEQSIASADVSTITQPTTAASATSLTPRSFPVLSEPFLLQSGSDLRKNTDVQSRVHVTAEENTTASNEPTMTADRSTEQPARHNGSPSVLFRSERHERRTERAHPYFSRPFRSEMWNLSLGRSDPGVDDSHFTISPSRTIHNSAPDVGISVETGSNIPVYSFISYPSESRYSSSVSGLGDDDSHAVATATARTPRHVHTAVVIARRSEAESETTLALRTAVNRAIAGAYAGNGEAAVATNIINTTHRLQYWDLNDAKMLDLTDSSANVIVSSCKLHNDGSLDISEDGSLLAVFVPSSAGFPENGKVCVYSLRKQNFGQLLYHRAFGPNAICLSFSPLNSYLLVGLASKRVRISVEKEQLVGQVLKLPENKGKLDKCTDQLQIAFNVVHPGKRSGGTSMSVNTVKFHPIPGVGVIYGTNQGTVRHCRIGPCRRNKKSGQ